MAACTLHHDAYCVAYLHICRYNSKAVNGVLVGSVDFDVHLDDASRDWLNTALLA